MVPRVEDEHDSRFGCGLMENCAWCTSPSAKASTDGRGDHRVTHLGVVATDHAVHTRGQPTGHRVGCPLRVLPPDLTRRMRVVEPIAACVIALSEQTPKMGRKTKPHSLVLAAIGLPCGPRSVDIARHPQSAQARDPRAANFNRDCPTETTSHLRTRIVTTSLSKLTGRGRRR